jgi:CubicO group peptidase (beta-lactamase class C family)
MIAFILKESTFFIDTMPKFEAEHDGVRLMEQSTIENAIVQQATGFDAVIEVDNARRAVGYKLVGPEMGASYDERAFGHGGFGGTISVADPDKRMSLGYVMNKPWAGARGTDPRASSLADVIYECIG